MCAVSCGSTCRWRLPFNARREQRLRASRPHRGRRNFKGGVTMQIIRLLKASLCAVATMSMASAVLAQAPLRIGAINPYSGPLALYGDEVARGYQLAVDEQNAKGGVLGRKIELW